MAVDGALISAKDQVMEEDRLFDAVRRLSVIMKAIRAKCPWDQRQNHQSLRRYLIEEAHEVLEALDAGDSRALRAELGDLLFQVFFHAELASEVKEGGWDIVDVLRGVADKLERRHPHVFGDAMASDAKDVREKWDDIKLSEGRTSRLEGIPPFLPALLMSQVVQDKAHTAGFRWSTAADGRAKVREEVEEFLEAAAAAEASNTPAATDAMAEEFGDLLFALVGTARSLGIGAEDALRGATRKFMRRFTGVEEQVKKSGRSFHEHAPSELLSLWEKVKSVERSTSPSPGPGTTRS